MAFPPNSCSARARWLLALWKRAGGKARARRRCRHSHLGGGPDPASAARGGPRPRTGPCVQRLPSGEACFLWKMKRAGTLRSAVPLPNARLPRPHCRPTTGPGRDRGTPRLSAPQTGSVPTSWGRAGGLPRCPPGCWGTQQDAQPQGGQPGFGGRIFLSPLPLVCSQPHLQQQGCKRRGRATPLPPVTPCHPSAPCHGPAGRTWDPRGAPRQAATVAVLAALAQLWGRGEGQWWALSFLLVVVLLLLLPLELFFHKGLLKHKQPRDSGLRREAAEQSQCRAGRERARGGRGAAGGGGHPGTRARAKAAMSTSLLRAPAVPQPPKQCQPTVPAASGRCCACGGCWHLVLPCPRATLSHSAELAWQRCPPPHGRCQPTFPPNRDAGWGGGYLKAGGPPGWQRAGGDRGALCHAARLSRALITLSGSAVNKGSL